MNGMVAPSAHANRWLCFNCSCPIPAEAAEVFSFESSQICWTFLSTNSVAQSTSWCARHNHVRMSSKCLSKVLSDVCIILSRDPPYDIFLKTHLPICSRIFEQSFLFLHHCHGTAAYPCLDRLASSYLFLHDFCCCSHRTLLQRILFAVGFETPLVGTGMRTDAHCRTMRHNLAGRLELGSGTVVVAENIDLVCFVLFQ